MAELFKLAPLEPTPEMLYAGRSAIGILWIYQAMLEAAPQPPALGGEPEVVHQYLSKGAYARWCSIESSEVACAKKSGFETRELIERAHLAPLQAEIERQSTVIDRQKNLIQSLRDELTESYAVGSADRLRARCDEQAKALATLISVARTVNRNAASETRVPGDDEPQYRQRKEWIEYLLDTCAEAEALSKPAGSEQ